MKKIFLICTLLLTLPIQASTLLSPKNRIIMGCVAAPLTAAAVTLLGATAFFSTKLGVSFYKDLKKQIKCKRSKPLSKFVSILGMIYSGRLSVVSIGATFVFSTIFANILYSVATGKNKAWLFLKPPKII